MNVFEMINTVKIVMVVALLLFVSGCQQEQEQRQQALAAYVASIKSLPKREIEPIPVMRTYKKFSYGAEDFRDPFVPLVQEHEPEKTLNKPVVGSGIHPDPYRLKEVLESYDLAALRFVGTIEQKGEVWALVRDPEGVIHRVQVGNYIGQHDGEILTISHTEVTLKELVLEGDNMYIERDTSLSIDGTT